MVYSFVQVIPDLTREAYGRVVEELGDDPFEGLVVHLAGPCEEGWRIIQVWQSADDHARFDRERLSPALARANVAGIPPPLVEWLAVEDLVIGGPGPAGFGAARGGVTLRR